MIYMCYMRYSIRNIGTYNFCSIYSLKRYIRNDKVTCAPSKVELKIQSQC